MASQGRLPVRLLASYGVGSLGTATFSTVPGLLLLYYLTDVLGASAGLAGAVLFVPKVWDVVLAPLLGAACDSSATRRGSRRPWLLAGGLALPPLFALLFAAPDVGTPAQQAVVVGLVFVLASTAYSVFQIPYVALPVELSDSERIRIMAWRMVLLTVGILVAGAAAPAIADGVGGRRGYTVMGVAVAVLLALSMLGCWRGLRGAVTRPQPAHALPLRAQLRLLRGNRPFFLFLVFYILQTMAIAVMLAGVPYVATYRLDRPSATAVLFVALVGPAMAAVPVWAIAARRWGPRRCLAVATIGYTVGALLIVPAVAPSRFVLACVGAGALGVLYAAMQLMPFSILPDLIDADEKRSGRRQAGAFTGIWTAGETTGMALGPALYAGLLALTGFVSSRPDHRIAQPDTALTGVLLGFTVLPAVLLLVSLPLLRASGRAADRAGVHTTERRDTGADSAAGATEVAGSGAAVAANADTAAEPDRPAAGGANTPDQRTAW